jgi:hypothetical protein
MKNIIQFELDGKPVFIEVEASGETFTFGSQLSGRRNEDGIEEQSGTRFTEAIARIRPAAEAVLHSFKEMNTPDEIGLEFGIKFNAKAGAVFASVDNEATFKVSLKWKNKAD